MLRVSAVILWVESVCMLPACTARLDVVGRTSQLFGDEAVSASRRKRPRKTSSTMWQNSLLVDKRVDLQPDTTVSWLSSLGP